MRTVSSSTHAPFGGLSRRQSSDFPSALSPRMAFYAPSYVHSDHPTPTIPSLEQSGHSLFGDHCTCSAPSGAASIAGLASPPHRGLMQDSDSEAEVEMEALRPRGPRPGRPGRPADRDLRWLASACCCGYFAAAVPAAVRRPLRTVAQFLCCCWPCCPRAAPQCTSACPESCCFKGRPMLWVYGAVLVVLLVLGYVGAVVWSGLPYIDNTGPATQDLPRHGGRTVWHHAMQRTSRLPRVLWATECPARDSVGIESDVRLRHGVLTLHHNPFVPLYPARLMGTMTVGQLCSWLADHRPGMRASFRRTILKLDIKTVPAARELIAHGPRHPMPTHARTVMAEAQGRPALDPAAAANAAARAALQRLRADGVEVWYNADLVPHASLLPATAAGPLGSDADEARRAAATFPFGVDDAPALAAAALTQYDVLSVGFLWPTALDTEPYSAATLRPMVSFIHHALRTVPPDARLRARVTLALRWTQLLDPAAVAAVRAAMGQIATALGAAPAARHGLDLPPGAPAPTVPAWPLPPTQGAPAVADVGPGPRVFVTVWAKAKDRAMKDNDVRWLEATFPGVSVDTGGPTPVRRACD